MKFLRNDPTWKQRQRELKRKRTEKTGLDTPADQVTPPPSPPCLVIATRSPKGRQKTGPTEMPEEPYY